MGVGDWVVTKMQEPGLPTYLKGIEEELAVHADLPAQAGEGVRQAQEYDVVHSEHQHQDQGRFGKFPERNLSINQLRASILGEGLGEGGEGTGGGGGEGPSLAEAEFPVFSDTVASVTFFSPSLLFLSHLY